MERLKRILFILIVLIIAIPAAGAKAQSKLKLPNDITLEILGRGLIYSFSYQRQLTNYLGIESGVELLDGNETGSFFISVGGRLYALQKNASPCIIGGFVIPTAAPKINLFSNNDKLVYSFIGPGFEYRSSGGFLLRCTIYLLIHDQLYTFPGIEIGISF